MTREEKFGAMPLEAPDAISVIAEMISVASLLISSGSFRQEGIDLLIIAGEYAQAASEIANHEVSHD